MKINELCRLAHENARNKGFWDKPREFGTLIALLHSELSEALEADRNNDRDNLEEELGDTCIRIFDLCGSLGIDLEKVITLKMEKNKERPRLHGKLY